MNCNKCYKVMTPVMSFSKKQNIKYYRCPFCGSQSQATKLLANTLSFVKGDKK